MKEHPISPSDSKLVYNTIFGDPAGDPETPPDGLYTSGDVGGRVESYLGRYYDSGITVPADLSAEVITGDEIGRLVNLLSVVTYAAGLPRRLGGEATNSELALDKKRGRRTTWALNQALRAWAGRTPKLDTGEATRRAAAQLIWAQWQAEHGTQLNARMRLVATWAMQSDDGSCLLFGNRAMVKLSNELNWISYALRD